MNGRPSGKKVGSTLFRVVVGGTPGPDGEPPPPSVTVGALPPPFVLETVTVGLTMTVLLDGLGLAMTAAAVVSGGLGWAGLETLTVATSTSSLSVDLKAVESVVAIMVGTNGGNATILSVV